MNITVQRDPESQVKALAPSPYDLESILPLDVIRQHTKTDDVPSVTDFILKLYRKAALEAAQSYTNLLLTDRKVISENVKTPSGTSGTRGQWFNHVAQYTFVEQTIYYYGLKNQPTQIIGVKAGTREARLPRDHDEFGLGCCNPCGTTATARIQYVAGYSCESEIPSAIQIGALKYIAHLIMNAGDNVMTSSSQGGKGDNSASLSDANNPALASGAIEIWRSAVSDAI